MTNCKRLFRALLLAALLAALSLGVWAADSADSPAAFYSALEQSLKAQKSDFSIAYTGDRAELGLEGGLSLGAVLRAMSAQSADGPDNADYPALNVRDGSMRWQDGAFRFEIEYLATPGELQEVARRAGAIAAELELEGLDDYTKAKLIYEYIGTHYVYDDTLTKFSAYDGLTTGSMVCQGYALLTYRVMWNAGIPCRIVTGLSSRENHAWNIVRLDGRWYNLDVTWDAADEAGGVMDWSFFLKAPEDFPDHSRFPAYETAEYEASHPMARTSWTLPRVRLTSNGSNVGNLVCRVGVPVQLEAELTGRTGLALRWSAADPARLAVTDGGTVTASALGSTVLTIEAPGDRGVIAARIPTQIVDLQAASPWAREAVTSYYLAQLLPVQFCERFQQPITRGELAQLCYHYVLQVRGWEAASLTSPSEDIVGHEAMLAILRCQSVGLMQGVSETTFAPDRTVTREQAAAVLVRLMAYLDGEAPSADGAPDYADAASISPWAREAVAAAGGTGVLRGTGQGFRPQDPMTREQMAAALHRIYAARVTEDAA